MRPKRTDDKYWTGTRDFKHIQHERDLEDYIIDLENETKQLRKHDVMPALQYSDDMCFHECPECNCRCNCSNQPCSCCN